MTSIAIATPAPLSVAPVPDAQIKVSTEHDNLIFQLWISTGNLGDGVETMLVVTGNLRIDVQLDY